MSETLKRSRISHREYSRNRKKRKNHSVDAIRRLVNGPKGEPIQALYMVFNNDSISFETSLVSSLPVKFVSFLNLKGYSFLGYGDTKISSRSSASKAALAYLVEDLKSHENEPAFDFPLIAVPDSEINIADIISSLVFNKYDEIRNLSTNTLPWFKVLSAIVMIRENDYRNGEVLVLATGSKCIEQKNIKIDGTIIMDSHAEILTRRAFQYFLYKQIKDETNSILENIGEIRQVRKEISFYSYVSSAPCGDCRIFAVSDRDTFVDKHPNRSSRGVLRIKLDGSNSTVPIDNHPKYEADNRLIIMSCSDKYLKANVLGMQGTLLSRCVKPVYLAGIVVGDLFHKSHISRALYGRLEGTTFKEPFRLNRISVHGVSKSTQMIVKSPKMSINWIRGESIEIINSTTGKTDTMGMSRLCKRRAFERFAKLMVGEKLSTYASSKLVCKPYQEAKRNFYDIVEMKKLGKWVRRDGLDQFSLAID